MRFILGFIGSVVGRFVVFLFAAAGLGLALDSRGRKRSSGSRGDSCVCRSSQPQRLGEARGIK